MSANGHGIRTMVLLLAAGGVLGLAALQGRSTPEMMPAGAAAGDKKGAPGGPYLVVLGTAQDAGYPQAGCQAACCARAWDDRTRRRHPSCVAVVDPATGQRWMFDCTPGFPEQLRDLDRLAPTKNRPGLDGIFLTHAHIGHYTGLMHLGKEVMGASKVPAYCLPRMAGFLRGNGPWSQLVQANHIELRALEGGKSLRLNERLQVTPLLVPHRSEFSETVGFRIEGPKRAVLYLPDIDRWEDWATRIEDVLKTVDRAYLDGTFYDETELPGRDIRKVLHPFITASLRRFGPLPAAERGKVHFLHLNHTNPALDSDSEAARAIRRAGCHIAEQGGRFEL